MSCVFCGGKIVAQKVTFMYEQDGQFWVIQNVPAEVCVACGEKTFAPEIADEMLKFAKRRFEPVKLVEMPVFDYGHKVAAVAI